MEESDAQESLKPYMSEFVEAMKKGWATYMDLPAEVRVQLTDRSRADNVHDFQVHQLRLLEEESDALRSVEKQGLYVLTVNAQVAIRFKKFGPDRLPCGTATQQVKDFRGQERILLE